MAKYIRQLSALSARTMRLLVLTRRDAIMQLYASNDRDREAWLRDLKAFCDEIGLDYGAL